MKLHLHSCVIGIHLHLKFYFISLVYHFLFSPSLWETARYTLKYCLKGPLSPKQPTDQPTKSVSSITLSKFVKTVERKEYLFIEQIAYWVFPVNFKTQQKFSDKPFFSLILQKWIFPVGDNGNPRSDVIGGSRG